MSDPREIIEAAIGGHTLFIDGSRNQYMCAGCSWVRPRDDDEAHELHDAHRATVVRDALADAGLLLPPGGRDLYVVIKSVPGRAPEIMADIVSDLDELRQWLADLRNDPDRDPLATYAGYRLAPSDTPGEPA